MVGWMYPEILDLSCAEHLVLRSRALGDAHAGETIQCK